MPAHRQDKNIYLLAVNSYSASHDNWCTATLWNRVMTAQCEGMGEVGSARYEPALLPPCPSIRALCYATVTVRDPPNHTSSLRVNMTWTVMGFGKSFVTAIHMSRSLFQYYRQKWHSPLNPQGHLDYKHVHLHLEFEFLCCLITPGHRKDIWRHIWQLYSHQVTYYVYYY